MASTTTTASSVTTSGVLSVASVSGITTRQTVRLTGTAFGGLVADQTYYIIAVGSLTITLSLTAYGSAISVAGGSGSMTVTTGPAVGPGQNNIVTADVAGDYNSIQALAAKVLGSPTDAIPNYGYNQTVFSSQVAVSNKIFLNHWTNLRSDMIKARGHQSGSASESNNISLPTSLSLITEDTRLEYLNYVNVIDTYRNVLGAGQFTIDTAVIAKRIDDWNGNLVSTITMAFGDNPTMRAFFNAGGVVKFSVGMTGTFNSFSALKDNTWTTMFTQMGTITFDRAGTTLDTGSTGTTTSIGFFNLTNSDQVVFTKDAPAGAYASNKFIIYAKISSGTLTFTVNYNDLSTGAAQITYPILVAGSQPGTVTNTFTPGGVADEYIDGIITQNCVLWRPSGSYVNITSPTITLAGDFQNASGAVYGLSADKYAVNEGATVTITLQTSNVSTGTSVTYLATGATTYTINGLNYPRFSAGTVDSYFTVGSDNKATISFTVANNYYTDGITSFTVALYNGLASTTIYINDTSTTPVGNQLFTATGGPFFWQSPTGVRNATVLIVGGGGGGGNFGGGGGGGGQARVLVATVLPLTQYSYNVGTGGGSLQNGTSSGFNGNNALGGNGGFSGNSTGHNGTHTGGTGGASGSGQAGATGGGSTGTTMTLGGGGGGGSGAPGSSGSSTTGGRGGPGLAYTYYGVNTIYVSGGGGGGGTVGSDPVPYTNPGYYGAGVGGGMDTNGYNAPYYGGGGGGGGVSLTASYNVQANVGGNQLVATLLSKSGGQGANGFVWVFWPQ